MVRLLALLLTVLTGFSGLVYEVTWEKYLATLLGSHSEATAAVLGLFLGGLALGYGVFGRVTRLLVERAARAGRPPHLLRTYGIVEAGIGVYALIFPGLFLGVQALSLALPRAGAGLGFVVDVFLAALLIVPPAVLMGGTIPMLTQALARDLKDATRLHAGVYAFNTAGAFAGALAAGFWLIPRLGLVNALACMAVLNLLAGAIFVALGRRGVPQQATPAPAGPRPDRIPGFAALATVALLVGFAMMTLQTVLIRLGSLSFGASQLTFSMVVAAFVLCIALGSAAVSALPRIPRRLVVIDLWGLLLGFVLLYPLLQDAPYYAHQLRIRFGQHPANFYPFHLAAFLGVLGVIGLPVALSGASLPLIFDHLRREFGELGDTAGRLYSWNTVGSLLGALLGGYALLFWLDLDSVFRVAIAGLAVAAVVISVPVLGVRRVVASALLVPLLAAVVGMPSWDPRRLTAGLFRRRVPLPERELGPAAVAEKLFAENRIVFHRDDPIATVTVREHPLPDGNMARSIVNNGKSDGSVPDDYLTMALVSLLTALFADKAERSFVIGYGTGVSVGELAALDSARQVVVAEISPAVMQAAPLFDYGNLSASRNPKVEIIRSDAYRALLRSSGSFDVIVSEPSNPWVTGVEMLYSREFLEAARDKLAPGGVYGQWIHMYETDVETLAIVFRTYAAVFEHVSAWYTLGSDLILMGFRDAGHPLDLERLARRVRRPDFAAGLARCGIRDLESLLAHEILPLGVIQAARLPGPLHTLLHPRLGYAAARAFFAGLYPLLPTTAHLEPARVGFENSLLRRHVDGLEGGLTDPVRTRILRETCRFRLTECYTLLAQWTHSDPVSRSRDRLIAEFERTGVLPADWDPGLVTTLAALYSETPPRPGSGVPLQVAVDTAKYFAAYFHHAAPFSRRPLSAAWDGCQDDPEQPVGCAEMRRRVELLLGPLDTE